MLEKIARPHLCVSDLHAFYDESHVLHGMSFEAHEGEVITLLGRNGAGKTTTMRAIMGLMRKRTGSVQYGGVDTMGWSAHQIARLGVGYCPEDRGIFASLTVSENLELPPVVRPGGLSLEEIHALFPVLAERGDTPGRRLSGGQQQMLAIARILRTGAKLLLLDEPTEGLAPVVVDQIGDIVRAVKQRGFTIVLVEQNFEFASTVADRHYVVENGRVVDVIVNADLPKHTDRLHRLLGV